MKLRFRASGLLNRVCWWLFSDVLGQPIGPISEAQADYLNLKGDQ